MIAEGLAAYEAGRAALSTARTLIDASQAMDKAELRLRVAELASQVQRMVEDNVNLRGDVTALKEQLRLRDELTFKDNSYWKPGGTGPFCSRCFEADGKVIRLHGSDTNSTKAAVYYICPVCKTRTKREGVRLSDLQHQQRSQTITRELDP